MKNLVLTGAVLWVVSACQGGITLKFPVAPVGAEAGIVTVIREDKFVGGGVNTKIGFDGRTIAHLYWGEHIRFFATTGQHDLTVVGVGTLRIDVEPNGEYFFVILTDESEFFTPLGIFEFVRITKHEAASFLTGSEDVSKMAITP